MENLYGYINQFNDELVKVRRYLHKNPELSFEEFKTQKYIYGKLKELKNANIHKIQDSTSIIVTFHSLERGENICFRADIDALPIQEENNLDFSSKNDGVMHACGHDAHTSILLSFAKYIDNNYYKLKGDITLIFQHAEELPPGGAIEITKTPQFQKIDKIFGLHVDTTIDIGNVAISEKEATASVSKFNVEILGKGGHSAYPNISKDPIALSIEIINDIYYNLSKQLDPREPVSLVITQIKAGSASNIIPNKSTFSGSLRTFSSENSDILKRFIENIIKSHTNKNNEYSYKYNFLEEYLPVINDIKLFNNIKNIIENETDLQFIQSEPMLTSEDFSAYTNEKAGCFILIGAKNSETFCDFPHHHPRFNIDENSMTIGLLIYIKIFEKFCMKV